jgi:hypothetical protein
MICLAHLITPETTIASRSRQHIYLSRRFANFMVLLLPCMIYIFNDFFFKNVYDLCMYHSITNLVQDVIEER